MNWRVLKQKFPKSYPLIEAYSNETGITDSRRLLTNFLVKEGFDIRHTFIHSLKRFEKGLL